MTVANRGFTADYEEKESKPVVTKAILRTLSDTNELLFDSWRYLVYCQKQTYYYARAKINHERSKEQ